jgi:hypothetical protein
MAPRFMLLASGALRRKMQNDSKVDTIRMSDVLQTRMNPDGVTNDDRGLVYLEMDGKQVSEKEASGDDFRLRDRRSEME